MKSNTRDLEESLTVNQDLVEETLNTIKSQLKVTQNEVSENKAELKEQLRIQEDRSRRNNIRVDGIEEDENKTLENTKNKLTPFLYNELETIDELFIERAPRVRRRESVKSNGNNTPRTIVAKLLDYKEKEEIMRRRYKLKDTMYSIREDVSKGTVEIRKKLWDQVNKLREDGKYAVIKFDKIVTRDFRTRRLYVFFGVVVLFFRLIIILFKMNTPESDFKNLKFSSFDLQNILLNNSNDPDDNFFNTNQFSDTNYFTIEETKSKLFCSDDKSFSVLHLNIRSLKKNFDKLVDFLATLSFDFKVICISETWFSSEHNNNDLYKLTN